MDKIVSEMCKNTVSKEPSRTLKEEAFKPMATYVDFKFKKKQKKQHFFVVLSGFWKLFSFLLSLNSNYR